MARYSIEQRLLIIKNDCKFRESYADGGKKIVWNIEEQCNPKIVMKFEENHRSCWY